MVVSNELNPEYFAETAKMMFDLIVEVYEKTGVRISFVDLGAASVSHTAQSRNQWISNTFPA